MYKTLLILFLTVVASLHGVKVQHSAWDHLLKKYVSTDGTVHYKNFTEEDKQALKGYLNNMAENLPSDEWTNDERKAYWINVYNAVTVDLILDHYPVGSIKDLDPFLYVPGLNTVWHQTYFLKKEKKFSLDEIEHEILRVQFNDPRIHFAINCASMSCPPLRMEAYIPSKLDSQLEEQSTAFINSSRYNIISSNKIELSKIFSWFRGDFTRESNLIQFLNKYSEISIESDAQIEYLEYNWELNE